SSPLDGDAFHLRSTTSTMTLKDSLADDAFLDQGIFFAVSSFLMFEVHLTRSAEDAAPRNLVKFIVVSVLSWFTLPFLYVPFDPNTYNELYHGYFDSLVIVILGIVAACAVSCCVQANLIGALCFYAIGGFAQFLRLFDVVGDGFNSLARLALSAALSLSLRAGTRFISEISRGRDDEYIFHVLMNTVMQVLLIGFAPLINRQVFEHVVIWAIIFFFLFMVTLILLILHVCCQKKDQQETAVPTTNAEQQRLLERQQSASKPTTHQNPAQAWKDKITQSKYWVARKAIPHVVMIVCTDAMLLIVVSKRVSSHEGWIKQYEEPITVVSQAAVMLIAGGMRCVYRAFVFPRLDQSTIAGSATNPSTNCNTRLECCLKCAQAGMFAFLIMMTLMIFFDVSYAHIVY
ncbi:hypothetical protein PENTCL1PPCAC_4591, partial [Pristionchus entomophagus]